MGTAGQSITLANSIIGVGILAMPFCFQQCGVVLATVILLLMGLVSRLCCYFLLKSALLARRRNFEFLAFHVFGPAGKFAVEVGIIGFLMGTCIAYFVVVGDLGPQIIAKMFNINQSDILRTSIMVIVSVVCVLPLGLLRNVDSLSNVSAATIGFYFCLVIKVVAEAATQLFNGEWQTKVETWKPSGVLQCVPIFSMALFCQTQLFEIFESLPTLSLEKMNLVTKNAINICTGVYFTLGLFGYIAFCSHDISGNILMSLSPTWASDVIKLGFVMSVAFSFPLIIFPCRASLYSLLYKKVHSTHHDHIINHSIPETTFRCITVAIVAVALFISLLIPNIELVLGLVGSTIGVLICVVFPAACFVNVTFKNTNERVLAKSIIVLGLVIMVLGTYANLQAAENQVDRYDDKITQERIDKIVEDFFEQREKNNEAYAKISNGKLKTQSAVIAKQEITKAIKDSKVQPPNPVPPLSKSNEKQKEEIKKLEEDIKEIIPPVEKLVPVNEINKVLDAHPKNIQTKLKEAETNNGKRLENEIEANKETKLELPQEVKSQDKVDKTQEKMDMIKHQQLIETIKQHGEEQKELIKEQKEILDEIKKTKDEIKQDKQELVDAEAKKIAVESIKKIANMAIQSLSGVTDKPKKGEKDKAKETLELTANEAVQEIAKKAVETMEALKEGAAKERLGNSAQNVVVKNPVPVQNNPQPVQNIAQSAQYVAQPVQNNVQPVQSQLQPVQNNEQPIQKLQPNIEIPNPQANMNNNANEVPIVIKENDKSVNIPAPKIPHAEALVQNSNIEAAQNAPVVNSYNAQLNIEPVVNHIPSNQGPSVLKSNQDQKQVEAQNQQENVLKLNQVVQENGIKTEEKQKEHSHSPDEPQSYKLGEDSVKIQEMIKNVAENVPIPIVMNGNNNVEHKALQVEKEPIKTEAKNDIQSVNSVQNDGAKDSFKNVEDNVIRQKREVVDCTKTMSLQPQDREICKTLLNRKIDKDSEEILPSNVDFNNLVQRKTLPDALLIPGRSLQSINTDKKR